MKAVKTISKRSFSSCLNNGYSTDIIVQPAMVPILKRENLDKLTV